MNACRILVASSKADKRGNLRAALELEGHAVDEAATAEEAVQRACAEGHDVLVMDSVVERIGAHGLCRAIRSKSDLGIIVLADDETTQGRIDALNAGADDYVSGPLILAELLARVRAILRRVRQSGEREQQIVLHDRAINLNSRKVQGPGAKVAHLTPKEFLVLQHLVAHTGRPLTHQSIAQSIWQRDGIGEVEYLRIVIKQLRRKLEPDPDHPRYIRTRRAVGYQFHMPEACDFGR